MAAPIKPEDKNWLLKIRRHDGSTSVIKSEITREQADRDAAWWNAQEQTKNYYAEEWKDGFAS